MIEKAVVFGIRIMYNIIMLKMNCVFFDWVMKIGRKTNEKKIIGGYAECYTRRK